MKVYLHIGSHKTGTTSIQDFSFYNRTFLLERGLYYPGLDIIGMANRRSHLDVVEALSGRENKEITRSLSVDFFKKSYDFALREGKDLLISAENIYRFNEKSKFRVVDHLNRICESVEVIPVIAFRDQVQFLDSLYRNSFRSYKRKPDQFSSWLKKMYLSSDYYEVISYWRWLTGSFPVVLPYDAYKDDWLNYFFSQLDVDISSAPHPERRKNASLDCVDCIAKDYLFGLGVPKRVLDRFNKFCFNRPLSSGYTFFSHEDVSFLEEKLCENNRKLVEQYPSLGVAMSSIAIPEKNKVIDDEIENDVSDRLFSFSKTTPDLD